MNVIGTKWVYVIKPAEKAQGDPTFKARFVAKGSQQIFGQNYFDTGLLRLVLMLFDYSRLWQPQHNEKFTTSMFVQHF